MSSSKFSKEVEVHSTVTYVHLRGAIDEEAVLSELRSDGTVRVDLAGVKRINSIGIRTWCLWLQRFREPVEVVLLNCPVLMVKNFTSIRGFLTERCRVYSFAVPFYSEQTGERKDHMATWGTDFNKSGLRLPEIKDSQGNAMVVDVPQSYFRFIKL